MTNEQKAIMCLVEANALIQRTGIPGDVMYDFHTQLEDMIEYLEEVRRAQADTTPIPVWSIDDNRC